MSRNANEGNTKWHDLLLFVVVLSPFYLNDLVFIATDTVLQWLVADNLFRILALIVIFAFPPLRVYVIGSFGPLKSRYEPSGMAVIRVGAPVFLCCLVMIAIEYFVRLPLLEVFPDTDFFRYPRIKSPLLYWFDMTFGLALVAVSEEFVFRSIAKNVIARFSDRTSVILVVSSVIFALAHWSHGIPNVVANFFDGLVLMALYLRTRSIVPSIITHYAINVWTFA